MNRYKKLLIPISLLAPFLICAVPIKITTYDISSNVIGPFKEKQLKENVVLKVTTNSLIDKPIIGRLCIYDNNNKLISMSKSAEQYISKYSPVTLYLTMNFPSGIDNSGFIIDFDLLEENVIKWTSKANIKLINDKEINVLSNKAYVTPATSFYFKGKNIITLTEKYDFDNIYDYFPVDYYQKLDISKFSFNYKSSANLTYDGATLFIYDTKRIFPHLQHEEDDITLRIPLEIYKDNSEYHIRYGCNLYVDPTTFKMSFVFQPNYKKTNSFYLPINRKKDILDTKFEIVLYECGDNKITFNWELDYLVDTNIVGNCSDSAYCVIGGIKE